MSVVIPCYNEEANLKRGVLLEVENYLKKKNFSWEVIISDDGSTDQSRKQVKEFIEGRRNFFLLENKHGGKAFAMRAGVKKARGEVLLTIDMDQSTPINQLERLLPYLEKGFDVVVGSRGLTRKGTAWYRKLMSVVFRFVRGFFILPEIEDTQCGFKLFRQKAVRDIFSRMEIFKRSEKISGWRVSAFDVEILFLAKKRGCRIKEVRVDWQDQDVSLTKKHNFLNESQKMAQEVIRVRWNDFRGVYDD